MGEDGGKCLVKSQVAVMPNSSEMNIESSEVVTSTVKSTVQVMRKTEKDRSDGEISSSEEDNYSSHHNHKDRDYYYSGKEKYKRSRHSEDSGDEEYEYGDKRYRKNGSPERRRPHYDETYNKTSTEKRSHRYEGRNSDLSDNHRRYNEERKRGTQERRKGDSRLTEDDYSSKKREKEHEIDMPKNSSSVSNERKQVPESNSSSLSNQTQTTTTSTDVKKKTAIGAYIPPSKLREMQAGITDKNSKEYQRMSWEALKKSINGLVNKVNTVNIEFIVMELLHENIVRGRGLVAQTIIRAQVASPTFTPVYASLVSIINTKFPKVGELILRRLIIQFRKAYKRNDKRVCINSVKFIGHLINQQVAHELLALQILTLMLHNHTGDSVEVAVSFLKEVGQKLLEVSPKGVNAVFERLRNILHDSQSDKRVQYMIEVLFHVRKDGFRDFQIIPEGLDNVEEDDQITHLLQLDDEGNEENILNVFKFDPEYVQNEEKYTQIKKNILGEDSDSSSGDDDDGSDGDDDDDDDDNDDDDDENSEEKKKETEIIDMTQTNLVALRRKLFLTIQSSLDFEECAHKMLKINLKDGQQHEFCLMVIEACAQDRSYQKFYGNLAHRFCLLRREFMEQYVIIFKEQYDNCHHLDTNKLRNTAKLFGHLLWSDGVPWSVLENIKLNEEETTASSRIFIKIIFQEVSEFLGIQKLLKRLKDPTIGEYLEGLFPRDNPVKTRFAVNFFTAIGLGILTDDLREHLRSLPKTSATAQKMAAAAGLESSSSSSSSSESSDSSSSSSSSDSSDSEGDLKKSTKSRHHKRTKSSPKRPSKNKVSHRSK